MKTQIMTMIYWAVVSVLASGLSLADVISTGVNTNVDAAYAADASDSDLVNAGSSTLTSSTFSAAPHFGPLAHNNGTVGSAGQTDDITYWHNTSLGQTYSITYDLNTTVNTSGYDITSIQTIHGWNSAASGYQKNQNYEVFVSTVGSADFTSLATVAYNPFTTANVAASTKVTLTENATGILASGIDRIRFTYTITGGGTYPSPTIREIDVFGSPTSNGSGVTPPVVTLPTSRQVVQRNASNVGTIPVTGTATAHRVEARAVGPTTTSWQTIANNPNGAFSGSLTGVAAGGWYAVEVRTVSNDNPSNPVTINKVGVGDIYITCGQSNSANYGSPAITASDDRVSAWNYANGAWTLATDPMPGAGGTGGSVWTRLGDLLAAREDIPVAFACLGVGSTRVEQWIPGSTHYESRLKTAVKAFPVNGFRAVLWHQGESDSIDGVSAATYASRLNSMITQSRTDAGWSIPWYVAEVSFHSSSLLANEEPVAAGQRQVVHADPLVFFGPSTDAFHLEDANGGKLRDSVHFNSAGLLDHATQWNDILAGSNETTPRNGNFEDNRTAAITGVSPLADGASHVVTTTTNTDSPLVIGWRILSASGTAAADGSNGFHNPTTGTYAAAADSTNNGIMTHMNGRHVAMLDGGAAGNYFLHSTRALAKPNTVYTLTASIGIRDNPASFGNARLEITANGTVVASANFDKPALDALRGNNAAGTFTEASLSWTTGSVVAANQPLAVRIVKVSGTGTVIDFDNVRFTATTLETFSSWISNPAYGIDLPNRGSNDDPDGDGLNNFTEYAFGLDPSSGASVNPILNHSGLQNTGTFSYTRVSNSILSYTIQISDDLLTWTTATASQIETTPGPGAGVETVTVALQEPIDPPMGSQFFVRVKAE